MWLLLFKGFAYFNDFKTYRRSTEIFSVRMLQADLGKMKLFAAHCGQLRSWVLLAGARYTKSIASLELGHKEHNNDPYSLHNNTIDFTE